MARIHAETTIERASVDVRTDRGGTTGARGRRVPRRTIVAVEAWLGTSTWPAYGAAAITAAYGLLKAYWVFGGEALWSIAPLSQEMIDDIRNGRAPTWFVIADVASVALAVAGVILALATVRRRRWLPVRLVRWALLPLAVFMVVLRAILSIVGDVLQIASGESGPLTHTALWDLGLWSPSFMIWGLLWAATALTYTRRADAQVAQPVGASSSTPRGCEHDRVRRSDRRRPS